MIRLATGNDQQAIIELIDAVLREYDDRVFVEGADADLLNIPANYFAIGGSFWVLEINGAIAGSHAAVPDPGQPDTVILRRLYLQPDLRGSGWGQQLMQVTIDWARQGGFRHVQFWSDTRFARAAPVF